jgi:hypothetical protein
MWEPRPRGDAAIDQEPYRAEGGAYMDASRLTSGFARFCEEVGCILISGLVSGWLVDSRGPDAHLRTSASISYSDY